MTAGRWGAGHPHARAPPHGVGDSPPLAAPQPGCPRSKYHVVTPAGARERSRDGWQQPRPHRPVAGARSHRPGRRGKHQGCVSAPKSKAVGQHGTRSLGQGGRGTGHQAGQQRRVGSRQVGGGGRHAVPQRQQRKDGFHSTGRPQQVPRGALGGGDGQGRAAGGWRRARSHLSKHRRDGPLLNVVACRGGAGERSKRRVSGAEASRQHANSLRAQVGCWGRDGPGQQHPQPTPRCAAMRHYNACPAAGPKPTVPCGVDVACALM